MRGRLETFTVAVLSVAVSARKILSFLTENVEMAENAIPDLHGQVRERGAGVNEAALHRLRALQLMIIHGNTLEVDQVIDLAAAVSVVAIQPHLKVVGGLVQELVVVVPADLEVAAIYAEAEGECPGLCNSLPEHGLINGPLIFDSVVGASAEPQYTICSLREEQVRLLLDTAKNKVKHIVVEMVGVAEVHHVEDHEAFVARSFSVALLKSTLFTFLGTLTVFQIFLRAVVLVAGRALVELVPRVQMLAARRRPRLLLFLLAVVGAWDSSYRTTRIHDEHLLLTVGAQGDGHVEVLQVSAIAK